MLHIETKWSVNESLLQSYRQIFISSQSFILALGVIALDRPISDSWLIVVLAVLSFIMIWYIWFRVVQSRHMVVDYYKYLLKKNQEDQKAIMLECSEEDYLRNEKKRKWANESLGIPKEWRLTRIKVDLMLPIIFSVIWILLLVINWDKLLSLICAC
jgi:hypothetical protein